MGEFPCFQSVISIDLGWSPENMTRTAAAYYRQGHDVWWSSPPGPDKRVHVCDLVAPFKDEATLVLLDIPVYGTEGLGPDNPFRPLDRVLLRCGVSLYPTIRAGSHGPELATSILGLSDNFTVIESYPSPVYRFMWMACDHAGLLEGGLSRIRDFSSWKKTHAPNPKRGRLTEKREKLARQVEVIGRFLPGDFTSLVPGPENSYRDIAALTDVCDALVALRVGMEIARGSPWVLEARVEGHRGMIPLLADLTLKEIWDDALARFQAGQSLRGRG